MCPPNPPHTHLRTHTRARGQGANASAVNMMYVSPLDLAREYNYSALVHLLLERGASDVDNTRARWDDLWADLEKAAAAGELGSDHGPFNASDVRQDMADIYRSLQELKTQNGPLGEYLRWYDEHLQILSGLSTLVPRARTDRSERGLSHRQGVLAPVACASQPPTLYLSTLPSPGYPTSAPAPLSPLGPTLCLPPRRAAHPGCSNARGAQGH